MLAPTHVRGCTPKEWIKLCNSLLLLFVTFMCSVVILEIYQLDQRFISILDSSAIAIDLVAVDLTNSQRTPSWQNVTGDIEVYSAFYEPTASYVLVLGSSLKTEVQHDDLRCLVKYADDDISVIYASHEKFPGSFTVYFYCYAKANVLPKKVSLISYTNTFPKQWTKVEIVDRTNFTGQRRIAACVRPTKRIVTGNDLRRFLSFHKMIGIEHFYIYKQNISDEVSDLARNRISAGPSLELLQWNKRTFVEEPPDEYTSVSVQDCLHRALFKYSDVIVLNEFDYLVLNRNATLSQIIDSGFKSSNESKLQLSYAEVCPITNTQSITKFRGEVKPSDANFILRPELTAAIQFKGTVTKQSLKKTYTVLPSVAIVNRHVENCEFKYVG